MPMMLEPVGAIPAGLFAFERDRLQSAGRH
jgi:hypothetical protein